MYPPKFESVFLTCPKINEKVELTVQYDRFESTSRPGSFHELFSCILNCESSDKCDVSENGRSTGCDWSKCDIFKSHHTRFPARTV